MFTGEKKVHFLLKIREIKINIRGEKETSMQA